MQKKVVLITGGSSGIGKSIGVFLKNKGYTVYGTTRDISNYPDFKEFRLINLDVRSEVSIAEAVSTIANEQGGIDILINNAGVGITGPLEEIPGEEVENHFAVNLFGPLAVIKAVLPIMRNQQSGRIINITSIAGYMGLPFRSIYSASKGALELVTESLRMEVKDFGIHVSNLAPGEFATDIASRRYHAPVLDNSPYRSAYRKNLELMNTHVDSGKDPGMVAKKVYRIIRDRNPKTHYKVGGRLQIFSIALKRILPDKVFEKLLLNHYKL